jgi:hypothetical protein
MEKKEDEEGSMKQRRLEEEEETLPSTLTENKRETDLNGRSREEKKVPASSSSSPSASSTSRRPGSASGRACKDGKGGRGPRSFLSPILCQANSTLHACCTTLCRASEMFRINGGKTTDTAGNTGTNQWERAEQSNTEGKFTNPGSGIGLAEHNQELILWQEHQPTKPSQSS